MLLKKIGFLILLAALPLFAGVYVTDGELKAEFEKDAVKIYCQKGQKLAMTLKPEPAIQNAYAEAVHFSKTKNALLIRGDNGSFSVMITDKTVHIPSANGIKNLNMTVRTEAVVLSDSLTEDDIVIPQKKTLRIPNFLKCFRIFANDQDLILNCICSARPADVTFRKMNGETQYSFPQSNGENMIFTFLTGKGVWAKFNGITKDFKVIDWKPPFSACYAVSFNRKGKRISYPLFEPNNLPYNYRAGGAFISVHGLYKNDPPTLWQSQVNFVAYPFVKNKEDVVQLRIPSGKQIPSDVYSPDNVYIYAFAPFIYGYKKLIPVTPADQIFPTQKIQALYTRGSFARSRTFSFPATCESTNRVEAEFMKGTAKKEAAELRNQLNRMDMFQTGIRARVEQYMRWSENMKNLLQSLPNYKNDYEPLLNGFKKIYASYAPKMKQVHECHALSLKMRKLIDADGDEEQQEEEIKKIGRAIRDMGGAQDACLGNLRSQAKKVRAQLLHDYVYGTPDKIHDWNISVIFDDMDKLFNGYLGMEGK